MSLPHAILASLLEKPCSGAELARRFDKSIGHFWQASHQQIYRELGKLDDAGMVESTGRDTGRGRERHYLVLPAGRALLEQWCRSEAAPRPVRDELLVRLRAAAVLGDVNLTAEISRHRELHQRQLEHYQDIQERDFPGTTAGRPAGGTEQDRLQYAVLRAGILFEEAWLAWSAETLDGAVKR
jgi:DNA-binding PadR family transcriptional regulator